MYRWVGGVGSARGRAAGQDRCVGVRRRRRQEQVRRTVCGAVGVVLVSCSESGCLPVLAAIQGEGDRPCSETVLGCTVHPKTVSPGSCFEGFRRPLNGDEKITREKASTSPAAQNTPTTCRFTRALFGPFSVAFKMHRCWQSALCLQRSDTNCAQRIPSVLTRSVRLRDARPLLNS